MRTYELMLVFAPDVDAKDEKNIAEMVHKLVAGDDASVTELTVMGKKNPRISYPEAQ